MKNIIKLLTVIALIVSTVITFNVFADNEIKVQVEGKNVVFDTMPVMENDRVLVPIRSIFEMIGGKVTWDENSNKAIIENDTMTIELPVGQQTALIYKKYDFTGLPQEVKLEVPAKIINDRTYVPIRFVSESLGMEVNWDNSTSTINIVKPSDLITVERPVSFTNVDITEMSNKEIKTWLDQNSQNRGVYYKTVEDTTYILACAGEKTTGGYSVAINEITMVAPGSLFVSASVNGPAPDAMVTQAITYPFLLVKINETDITKIDCDVSDLKDGTTSGAEATKKNDLPIKTSDVIAIELFNLANEKVKSYTQEEIEQLVACYNESEISDMLYPMMITGNKMVITLNDGSQISFISYGSETNIVASINLQGKNTSYHLICLEIAKLLIK